MDHFVDLYLLAIEHCYVGFHFNTQERNYMATEPDDCSNGELGLAGFAINKINSCKAQARGFTHGHQKVYGIPSPWDLRCCASFRLCYKT